MKSWAPQLAFALSTVFMTQLQLHVNPEATQKSNPINFATLQPNAHFSHWGPLRSTNAYLNLPTKSMLVAFNMDTLFIFPRLKPTLPSTDGPPRVFTHTYNIGFWPFIYLLYNIQIPYMYIYWREPEGVGWILIWTHLKSNFSKCGPFFVPEKYGYFVHILLQSENFS